MLAPTRDLVRALNQRARAHRLADNAPGRQVELADGNRASVGDLAAVDGECDSATRQDDHRPDQFHRLSDRPRSAAPALVDPWEVP